MVRTTKGVALVMALSILGAACKRRPDATSATSASPSSPPPPSASSSGAPAVAAVEPGTQQGILKAPDGRERRYFAHWPKGAPDRPPLLLVLHGGGGNAEGAQTTSFTHAAAEKHGVFAVYPEGVATEALGKRLATWNAGTCCGKAKKQGVDDVAFLAALVDHLKSRYPFDPERVYAAGISNGGMMATRLACERPDLMAGVSAIGSPGYRCDADRAEPVPVQIIHGTADRCALYAGGPACGGCWEEAMSKILPIPFPARRFPCIGAEDQAAFWRKVNGCTEASSETHRKGDATCRRWSDCESGKPVSLCTIDGGGHTWPGAERGCDPSRRGCRAYTEVVGPISRDLDAGDAMIAFFIAASSP